MPCAGRASSARGNRASRLAARPRHAELLLVALDLARARSAASRPSPVAVGASGVSRNMPLPRPSAVSNLKIASIAMVPARVTWRGAARSDRPQSRTARRWRRWRLQRLRDRVRAVDGLDVPAERQHIAPIAVGMEQRSSEAPSSGFASASSNCASQLSAATEISSVLSSMRVSLAWPSFAAFSLLQAYTHSGSRRKAVTR